MDTLDAQALALSTMLHHGLVQLGWTFCFDDARGRAGICRGGRKEIGLSRIYVKLNTEEEVLDTILHECAHALARIRHGENCGHDPRWQAMCVEIGAKPNRCCDAGVKMLAKASRWVSLCPHCDKVVRLAKCRKENDKRARTLTCSCSKVSHVTFIYVQRLENHMSDDVARLAFRDAQERGRWYSDAAKVIDGTIESEDGEEVDGEDEE